ncbi:MAG: gfo/Idh/MocA family oxidoreductase [Planctomycetota bacterium]|nr:MAG: gfo/Idh/MocA family oxidoreductase [Planctomycetota bacterium]
MTTRREFIRTAAATAAATALQAPLVHAGGTDLLKVGLIGCGGRGTGAAEQALNADPNVKLVAMGDAFSDRLQSSLKILKKTLPDKVDVKEENCFVGFDAYKGVLDASDVVLLCEPHHFRPSHIKAAIEAGKHVFAEKPVAVDGPGVRSVLETCELARKKNLSVVSGLCLRYSTGFQEMMKRVHDGEIGDVVALFANDYRSGRWARPRQEGWSDMLWHMRNWYNFTWLSGDFNVEQHVHYLDVCAWAMKDTYPVKALGMGGRQVLVEPEYGNIYDHFSVTYEYANGTRLVSNTRQQKGCKNDMSAFAVGTKGRATMTEGRWQIFGEKPWEYKGKDKSIYQVEHDEFFASIRSGKPINNGDYMSKSSLLAIMGRMAAYTGQLITWDQALNSKQDLRPAKYDWDLSIAMPAVAIPGSTKFF